MAIELFRPQPYELLRLEHFGVQGMRETSSLDRSLKKAWAEIPMEMISKIVDEFPKRLKKCVAANGGHFVQIILVFCFYLLLEINFKSAHELL